MSSKEDKEVLKLLVQHVCRGFYDAKYTIVMDQLVRHPVLKEDDLAGRLGLQLKELSKLTAVLGADKLLKIYRQNELKEGATRAQARQYYYIDYQHFCNVVKWRVSEMRRIIDSKLRNELDNKGYICPQCRKSYSPLDVDRLMDFMRQGFFCEDCKAEVIENENAESVKGSQDRMQRFNREMRFIREGLRKTEEMVLPAFDVQDWLRKHPSEEAKRAAEREGLKTAGANGEKPQNGMEIVMSMDKDEATRRAEREKEAEDKRKQNIMPSWHLKSTITGDLTALGTAALSHATSSQHSPTVTTGSNAAILESLTNPGARPVPKAGPSSNAAILSGLGTAPNGTKLPETGVKIEEGAKPVVDKQADYYDAYYASLNSSTDHAPVADSWGNFSAEAEDRKPDLAYLNGRGPSYPSSMSTQPYGSTWNYATQVNGNGVNEFGKRPREENSYSYGFDGTGDGDGGGEMALAEDVGFTGGDVLDDPIVQVNGKPMKFSEVTEEHHDLMTAEEYTAYFEYLEVIGIDIMLPTCAYLTRVIPSNGNEYPEIIGWTSLVAAAGVSFLYAKKLIDEQRREQHAAGKRPADIKDWRQRIEEPSPQRPIKDETHNYTKAPPPDEAFKAAQPPKH